MWNRNGRSYEWNVFEWSSFQYKKVHEPQQMGKDEKNKNIDNGTFNVNDLELDKIQEKEVDKLKADL